MLGSAAEAGSVGLVDCEVNAISILEEELLRDALDDGSIEGLALFQRLLRRALLGLVAEYENHAGGLALFIANGRTTVRDGVLVSVLANQQGVVGESDHLSLAQHARNRALDHGMGLFVDDAKDFVEGPALGFGLGPAG